jgi:hypothetical protein
LMFVREFSEKHDRRCLSFVEWIIHPCHKNALGSSFQTVVYLMIYTVDLMHRFYSPNQEVCVSVTYLNLTFIKRLGVRQTTFLAITSVKLDLNQQAIHWKFIVSYF